MSGTPNIKSLAKHGKFDDLVSCWSGSPFDLELVFERAVTDFRGVKRNQGHQKILRFCIENGLGQESRVDWLNQPLLCTAAMYANNEFVNWISEKGVPENPFVRASLGDLKFLSKFSKSELSRTDTNDWNLLHYVCASGLGRQCGEIRERLRNTCDFLLQRGISASHSVSNQVEITPALLCAWFAGDEVIMEKLLQSGDVELETLYQAVEFALEPHQRSGEPFFDVAETILRFGFPINSIRPEQGRTILHGSANRGSVTAVRWLLEKGADPNVRDDQQRTSLHVAAIRNVHVGVCELLIERGVDREAKDSAGKTALTYALENQRTKVADFLREG